MDPASTNERHDERASDFCVFVQGNSFLVEEGSEGKCDNYLSDGRYERGESMSAYAKV